MSNTKPAAQVAYAKKAAALKAKNNKAELPPAPIESNQTPDAAGDHDHHQHDCQQVHGARAPPRKSKAKKTAVQLAYARLKARVGAKQSLPTNGVRLLDKVEIMALTGVSYQTIWVWMREGKFPRSRILGGRSAWVSTEVDAWLAGLPICKLKGDSAIEENAAT